MSSLVVDSSYLFFDLSGRWYLFTEQAPILLLAPRGHNHSPKAARGNQDTAPRRSPNGGIGQQRRCSRGKDHLPPYSGQSRAHRRP